MKFQKANTRFTIMMKKAILTELLIVVVVAAAVVKQSDNMRVDSSEISSSSERTSSTERSSSAERTSSAFSSGDYIKWVDFNVSYEALRDAYEWDVDTYGSSKKVDWIELLAYTAAKNGGDFHKSALVTLHGAAERLAGGSETIKSLTKDLKHYDYYYEAYQAVLGGMVGEFEEEYMDENGERRFRRVYGLKAFFPLAKGFEYSHFDDFGSGRNYGYKRKHLGHDLMGQIGTAIWIICGMINWYSM